jgi:NDP-sugar pyrophosphorylase family protein
MANEHLSKPIDEITAVILSGGLGTRLRPLTGDQTPKILAPIKRDQTVMDCQFDLLDQAGMKKAMFATSNHVVDRLITHVSGNYDRAPLQVLYAVEGEPVGVINAIRGAIEQGHIQDPFVLLHGDEILRSIDLGNVYQQHSLTDAELTCVGTTRDDGARNYVGVASVDGRLHDIYRNTAGMPDSALILTGTFIINPQYFLDHTVIDISWRDLLQNASDQGVLFSYKSDALFLNMNTPNDLDRMRRLSV